MFDDEFDGGPVPAVPQPGLFRGMQNSMDQMMGIPEVADIIGIGQEDDWLDVDAEFGGAGPVPLSSYGVGDEGVYGGLMGDGGGFSTGGLGDDSGLPPDPMDDEGAAEEMRDMLSEKAQARLSASERFQQQAGKLGK